MNILFYVEPIIEREKPYWKKEWVNDICFNIINTLEQSKNNYSFTLITNEAIEQTIEFENKNLNIHVFTQEELLKPFGTDYNSASSSWHMNSYSQEQLSYYKNLMSLKLDKFIPDIIITFTPVPFFKELFKKALILHHEFSIFSRLPYPTSWFFDPIGVSSYSFYNHFKKDIEDISLDYKQKIQLEDFKLLCQNTLTDKSPFKNLLDEQRKKFKSLILLPLQFSRYYLFDDLVPFKSQYEYCVYVLDNIPKSIGVVVNMHPEYPILNEDAIKFLKSKYPNFICLDDFNSIYASGQFILPFVDGVISVSSSIALQALLFDKKIILLGNSCFEYIADAYSLKNIENTLSLKKQNKDNFLYHIITRYAVTSKYLHNPLWLDRFLTESLDTFREKGINENFYNLIDDEDDIFNHLSSTILYNSELVPQYVNSDLIQLFFDFGEGVDEKIILSKVVENENKQTFTFDLSDISPFYSLRLDPLDDNCVIELESFVLVSENSEKVNFKEIYSNAYYTNENRYFFESTDPQIFFIPEDTKIFNNIKKLIITINYLYKGKDALSYTLKNFNNKLSEQKSKIISLENIINDKKNEIILLQNIITNKENEYNEILNSKSMRMTAPLRKMFLLLKGKK